MARRAFAPPRARPNPVAPEVLLVVAGALAVGGATAWALGRSTTGQPSSGPTGAAPPAPPPPVTFPDPGPQPYTLTARELRDLQDYVLGDNPRRPDITPEVQDNFRLLFANRAALYSSGLSEFGKIYLPGSLLFAMLLDPAERDLNAKIGVTLPPSYGWTPDSGAAAPRDALRAFTIYYETVRPPMRPLPFNLPRAFVDRIDAAVAAAAPAMPRLYVHAT